MLQSRGSHPARESGGNVSTVSSSVRSEYQSVIPPTLGRGLIPAFGKSESD